MKTLKMICASALLTLLTSSAFAGDNPSTVVELFTSQGCSSCPPANQFVGDMAGDADKLVLSYGVTYWDYLGWKDTFGDPKFTSRQKAYGKALGIGNVYTPQIVLNGSAHSPRYAKSDVESMTLPDSSDDVSLSERDGELVLDGAGPMTVLVSFTPGWQDVAVKRGENHGRTLRLANVVTDVRAVDGDGTINIRPTDGLAYAALVHDPKTKAVIRAAVYTP